MATMQSFTSIPFKAKTFHGLSDVNGLAKFSGAGIVLEFETKLFGLISDGVKEARIPIGEVMDIKFKKGMFKRGAKIEIRTKSLATMVDLPNEDGTRAVHVSMTLTAPGCGMGEVLVQDVRAKIELIPTVSKADRKSVV